MSRPTDRDIPMHAFVLAAAVFVVLIFGLVELLELRSQRDCEDHGGMVVEIRNGWVCIPPREERDRR